jgi:hypothetical protein
MTTSPDKLFREQLNDFRKPAPQLAWERIEANLKTKKKGSFLWLKIAAVITIPVAIYIVWPQSDPPNIASSEETTPSVTQSKPSTSTSQTKTESTTREISAPELRQQDIALPQKNIFANKSAVKIEPTQDENKTLVVMSDDNPNDPSHDLSVSPVEENILQPQSTAIEVAPQKSNTLHYSTAEVNSRFKKKVTMAQATPEPKHPSILQTIGDIAYDIKNDDGLLGDLREKKNEIFSLDRHAPRHGPNK